MTRTLTWLLSACAFAAIAACYAAPGATDGAHPDASSSGSSSSGSNSGLPCDVQSLLARNCTACHGATPSGGAPMSLVSYEDLTKAATGGTMADLSLARMKNASSPMPPTGLLADISPFEAWVKSGTPKGSCTSGSTGASVCTSGQTWTRGNQESPMMHPGVACISCHQSEPEAPSFAIAGTVYPTTHEPDDCSGTSSATVVITDANGQETRLSPNSAGNFYVRGRIATPYKAKVVVGGKERAMSASQTSGDCNSCHTEGGANGAPGRITAP